MRSRWMRAIIPLLVSSSLMASVVLAAPALTARTFDGPAGKIWYEVRGSGSGRPLFVLNGGPGFDHSYLLSSGAWETLAKNRRVVMYDQRGVGRSFALKAGAPNTVEEQLSDLEALRAQLGAETVDLLGHSYGGYLGMAYAARYPQRVARLMLVDSAAPKWSETLFLFKQVFPEATERQDALGFASELGDKGASDNSIREYLTMLFYSPERREAFLKLWNPAAYRREVNAALNRDLERFDLNPEIRKFRMPVLVMTGRYDMNVAPLTAYKMHQAIPASRFVVFERSGHLPFLEEPEAFVAAIEEFLGAK
jgi:proline iminopeptidase